MLALALYPSHSAAWNAPAHMLNGAITYQILQRESASTINAVMVAQYNNLLATKD